MNIYIDLGCLIGVFNIIQTYSKSKWLNTILYKSTIPVLIRTGQDIWTLLYADQSLC
jgi:hypothetical protein